MIRCRSLDVAFWLSLHKYQFITFTCMAVRVPLLQHYKISNKCCLGQVFEMYMNVPAGNCEIWSLFIPEGYCQPWPSISCERGNGWVSKFPSKIQHYYWKGWLNNHIIAGRTTCNGSHKLQGLRSWEMELDTCTLMRGLARDCKPVAAKHDVVSHRRLSSLLQWHCQPMLDIGSPYLHDLCWEVNRRLNRTHRRKLRQVRDHVVTLSDTAHILILGQATLLSDPRRVSTIHEVCEHAQLDLAWRFSDFMDISMLKVSLWTC